MEPDSSGKQDLCFTTCLTFLCCQPLCLGSGSQLQRCSWWQGPKMLRLRGREGHRGGDRTSPGQEHLGTEEAGRKEGREKRQSLLFKNVKVY